MDPVIEFDGVRVFHGDCRDVLATLPDNSVDSVVTDPPYELGFMGKKWDSSGIAYDATVWGECLRVLKPGGHILAFGGSRTWHRLAVAIEDAGFEIRDNIAWIYGSGFPKSLDVSKAIDKAAGIWRGKAGEVSSSHGSMNGGNYERTEKGNPVTDEAKAWEGWGTALKPAHEPIVVGRKPLVGTVAQNVLEWGVGGLNIDGSRIEASPEDFAKLSAGVEAIRKRGGTMDNSWKNSSDLSGASPAHAQGRWPANVVFDEFTAGLLDEQSGVSKEKPQRVGLKGGNGGTLGAFGGSSADAVGIWPADPGGGASRFFYVAKASKRDRNEGLEELEAVVRNDGRDESLASGDMPQNRSNNPKQNFHPTVKPTALMRYLVKLVTPPGGVVLDPFTGSGSTGKAALLEGFGFVGVELTEDYLPIIEGRLRWAVEQSKVEDEKLF